jgi:hypothetical protein
MGMQLPKGQRVDQAADGSGNSLGVFVKGLAERVLVGLFVMGGCTCGQASAEPAPLPRPEVRLNEVLILNRDQTLARAGGSSSAHQPGANGSDEVVVVLPAVAAERDAVSKKQPGQEAERHPGARVDVVNQKAPDAWRDFEHVLFYALMPFIIGVLIGYGPPPRERPKPRT